MKIKSYDYVFLDWDGCLAKTLDIWLEAYRETFREFGLHIEDRIITHEVFGDWNGPIRQGVRNIDEYNKKLMWRVNKNYPFVKLYPHVRKVIKELRKLRKKLALITTSSITTIQPALINQQLTGDFDVVLTAEDVTMHKPNPEIINRALKKLNGIKSKALIIGDSKSDLGAAKNAGIDSLLFHPKHNELFYDLTILKTFNPTHIIDDFAKVLDIVK